MEQDYTNIIKHEKVCSKCGKTKPKEDFYASKCAPSGLLSWCKDCYRAVRRSEYARERKVPDGIKYDKRGRKLMHRGHGRSIYWDGNMLSILKRYYATTPNSELSGMLGISSRTIGRKASELGLKKDRKWLAEVQRGNAMIANAVRIKSGRKFWGNQYTKSLPN